MLNNNINREELNNLVPKVKKALERSNDLMGQEVWGNIMEEAPVDEGTLAGSWILNKQSPLVSVVSSNVKYALTVNDGSDPYTIYPKNAQALRFEIGGQTIFAKRVEHPGTSGNPYIDRGIEQAVERRQEFIDMALSEVNLI